MKIPVVNEQDEVIALKEKKDLLPEDINRDTGLWVVNEFGEILLAQRSLNKKQHPGLWAPAVAGTVEEGETYDSNIIKEAGEEIGLFNIKPKFLYKVFKDGPGGRRMRCVYEVKIPKSTILKAEPMEVMDMKWLSNKEIQDLIQQTPEIFVPSFSKLYNTYINEYANKS